LADLEASIRAAKEKDQLAKAILDKAEADAAPEYKAVAEAQARLNDAESKVAKAKEAADKAKRLAESNDRSLEKLKAARGKTKQKELPKAEERKTSSDKRAEEAADALRVEQAKADEIRAEVAKATAAADRIIRDARTAFQNARSALADAIRAKEEKESAVAAAEAAAAAAAKEARWKQETAAAAAADAEAAAAAAARAELRKQESAAAAAAAAEIAAAKAARRKAALSGAVDGNGIWSHYGENAIAADQKYLSKSVFLKTWGKVEQDSGGRYLIQVPAAADRFGYAYGVHCYIAPGKAAPFGNLTERDKITIRGICKGRVNNKYFWRGYGVIVEQCELADGP
jgi:hypothetical protein